MMQTLSLSRQVSVGIATFAAVSFTWTMRLYYWSSKAKLHVKIPSGDVKSIIGEMERAVQRDEGARGIDVLMLPPGELYQAASLAVSSSKVCVITGFPCLIDHNPPTETDGPLGAVAIARALLMAGKYVTLVTDECNEEVVLASCAAGGLQCFGERFAMESFPPADRYDKADVERFEELSTSVDLVVAIERAGPCADGSYRTMRGRDMTHLLAPLELLLEQHDPASGAPQKASIGIGVLKSDFN